MTISHSDEQDSPTMRCSRTLKGESIRSLRELFKESLLSSSSSNFDDDKGDDEEKKGQDGISLSQKENEKRNNGDESGEKQQQDKTAGGNNNNKNNKQTINNSSQAASLHRAADEMRSRLLQNLGIQKQQAQPPPPSKASAAAASSSATTAASAVTEPPPPSNSKESWGPSYSVPLNDDTATTAIMTDASNTTPTITATETVMKDSSNATESINNTNYINSNTVDDTTAPTARPAKKSKLQFNPTVVVHPIPSYKVYSNRIRDTIWTGAYELHDNVARNSLEFAYEDWDADHVLDEETGLIYISNNNTNNQKGVGKSGGGEWVHPVHFGAPPREEGTPLSNDEIWSHYTNQKLGIQPAEYFHSLPVNPAATKK